MPWRDRRSHLQHTGGEGKWRGCVSSFGHAVFGLMEPREVGYWWDGAPSRGLGEPFRRARGPVELWQRIQPSAPRLLRLAPSPVTQARVSEGLRGGLFRSSSLGHVPGIFELELDSLLGQNPGLGSLRAETFCPLVVATPRGRKMERNIRRARRGTGVYGGGVRRFFDAVLLRRERGRFPAFLDHVSNSTISGIYPQVFRHNCGVARRLWRIRELDWEMGIGPADRAARGCPRK